MREASKGGTSGESSSTSFFMSVRLVFTAESGAIGKYKHYEIQKGSFVLVMSPVGFDNTSPRFKSNCQ